MCETMFSIGGISSPIALQDAALNKVRSNSMADGRGQVSNLDT